MCQKKLLNWEKIKKLAKKLAAKKNKNWRKKKKRKKVTKNIQEDEFRTIKTSPRKISQSV